MEQEKGADGKSHVCREDVLQRCLVGKDHPPSLEAFPPPTFWEGDSLAHFVVFLFLFILYFIASRRALATHTPLLGIQHVSGCAIHAMFPDIQQTKRKGVGNEVRKKCFVLLKSRSPTRTFSIQFL